MIEELLAFARDEEAAAGEARTEALTDEVEMGIFVEDEQDIAGRLEVRVERGDVDGRVYCGTEENGGKACEEEALSIFFNAR